MKTALECIPCFVRQIVDVSQLLTHDRELQEKTMRGALRLLADVLFDNPPPQTAAKIHRMIRELSGEADPYRRLKEMFNHLAMSIYPEMKARVRSSSDPFETAVRIAIAGNAIDFGLVSELDLAGIRESISGALSAELDRDLIRQMSKAIKEARSILYIGDNAGEIVFDRILLEEMPCEKVTFSVRGYPILNDATMDDAASVGLTELVEVIEDGSDSPGTILVDCIRSFTDAFGRADLVIAKGQGNFETLHEAKKPVFFLFKAKCRVVARALGCETGTPIACRTGPDTN